MPVGQVAKIVMRARTSHGPEFINRAMAALNSADRKGLALTRNSSVSDPSRRAHNRSSAVPATQAEAPALAARASPGNAARHHEVGKQQVDRLRSRQQIHGLRP